MKKKKNKAQNPPLKPLNPSTLEPLNLSTLKPLNSLSLEPLKEGWKWVRLGEVLLTNPQYGLTATAENSEKDYIYIRITDITDEGKLKIEDLRFIDLDKEIFEKYKVFENDILIARSGSVGRIYLVKESDLPKPAVFASYLIRFKLNPNVVLPEYFFYFGLSEQYKNFILEQIKTVAQPNINAKQYQNIQFSLPPLPEQRRIVEKLKGIMEEIEKARSACEKELEAVKALPSAYLREVFESEEVKKWERRRLGEVCETTSGGTPYRGNKEYFNGNIPWVKSGELGDNYIVYTQERITELGLENSNAKILPVGTLLIAMYGATVGKLGILEIPASTNQAICAILPNEKISVEFLFFYFIHYRKELLGQTFGSAQPNISQELIRNTFIPLPPLPSQQRIADYLKQKMAEVEKLRRSIEKQLEAINALPQAYLRKAFRGEL